MKNNNMNDKKRSLRMRNFNEELNKSRFGVIKSSFNILPPLNLSNKTITGNDIKNLISMGKSFKNAIFTESILNDATFKNVDLTGANFFKATLNGVTFENCNLTRVNFSEANLYTKIIKPSPSDNNEDSRYIYTSFVNIDKFNNALFKKAKLYGVAFKNCNLTKADFSEAELTVISYKDGGYEYTEEYTVFDKVNLKEANFTSATLYSVSFKKNVNLRKADFTEAELSNLYISDFNVYLEDTLFIGATIKEVDFSYANYFGDPEAKNYDPKKEEEDIEYRYDYDGVKILSGLDFSDATLEGVNLAYSTFEEVNFSGANLLNVNFANSYLAYSNFSRAKLETNNSVNLNNIIFDNADLSDAQITNEFFFNTSFYSANLENVYFNKCWFKNLSFDESTFFGINDDTRDTRTKFTGCYVYIDDGKPIYEKINPSQYFLTKVFIEKSFINDDYYIYRI